MVAENTLEYLPNEGRSKLEIQISNEKLYNFLVTTVITSVSWAKVRLSSFLFYPRLNLNDELYCKSKHKLWCWNVNVTEVVTGVTRKLYNFSFWGLNPVL